ncbi:MAG: ATP-binding protein [Proteobacteria bacterium]|nr:ATP-binding protein [Pseudomonadota bacterium]
MYTRTKYISKIKPFIDKPVIKVITGMRRTGKSTFVKQLIEALLAEQTPESNVLYLNKESLEFDFIKTYRDLYEYVKQSFNKVKGKCYLFVDEVQEIENWEKAITSFFSEGNIDITITGSNAHLLSSEISTLISGRYVEFPLYALSFNEFLQFRDQQMGTTEKEFQSYLRFGGLPALHQFDLKEEVVYQYINSLYSTILLKDVIKRNNIRNVSLLENITKYAFDNVGNIFSAKKISDYLKSQRMSVSMETVQNYVSHLLSSFALFKVPRYDIKGKRLLEINEKYYLGDIGFRNALLGYKEADISGILENIVFLELKRRGYTLSIGKLDDKEIDFIAEKQDEKLYIQVAYLLASPETIEREFSVLKKVKDNYPKFVLSMDTVVGDDVDGIKRMNLVDFLQND